VGIKNIGSSAKNTKRSKKSQALGMTKGRAVTFIKDRQIGWTERNGGSLHCASLRPG
jgi:hypothetical protein